MDVIDEVSVRTEVSLNAHGHDLASEAHERAVRDLISPQVSHLRLGDVYCCRVLIATDPCCGPALRDEYTVTAGR